MKSNVVVYPRNNRSLLVGRDFDFDFDFLVRKNPRSFDCNEIRTHVAASESFKVTNPTTGATDCNAFMVQIKDNNIM